MGACEMVYTRSPHMFGLSFGELILIAVVALLVLGPSGLPSLARTLGRGLRDFRRTVGEVRGTFEHDFFDLDKEARNGVRSPPRRSNVRRRGVENPRDVEPASPPGDSQGQDRAADEQHAEAGAVRTIEDLQVSAGEGK